MQGLEAAAGCDGTGRAGSRGAEGLQNYKGEHRNVLGTAMGALRQSGAWMGRLGKAWGTVRQRVGSNRRIWGRRLGSLKAGNGLGKSIVGSHHSDSPELPPSPPPRRGLLVDNAPSLQAEV